MSVLEGVNSHKSLLDIDLDRKVESSFVPIESPVCTVKWYTIQRPYAPAAFQEFMVAINHLLS